MIRHFQTIDDLAADDAGFAVAGQLARTGRRDLVSVRVGHVVVQAAAFARDGAGRRHRRGRHIVARHPVRRFRLRSGSGLTGNCVLIGRSLGHGRKFGGRFNIRGRIVRRRRVRICGIGFVSGGRLFRTRRGSRRRALIRWRSSSRVRLGFGSFRSIGRDWLGINRKDDHWRIGGRRFRGDGGIARFSR